MIERNHCDLHQVSTALFSECERFRYLLVRTWDSRLPEIAYLMLNPSTADERKNDPTIERCQRRAISMGFGSMVIVNLFPVRETDSRLLASLPDLYGSMSHANQAILDAAGSSKMIICGWGKHELAAQRARDVMEILKLNKLADKLHCLKSNKDGSPQHPLYIGYEAKPIPYQVAL